MSARTLDNFWASNYWLVIQLSVWEFSNSSLVLWSAISFSKLFQGSFVWILLHQFCSTVKVQLEQRSTSWVYAVSSHYINQPNSKFREQWLATCQFLRQENVWASHPRKSSLAIWVAAHCIVQPHCNFQPVFFSEVSAVILQLSAFCMTQNE